MLKKYLRKKQYAKIKSYLKAKISLTQELIDIIPDDGTNGNADIIKECYIAQKVILKEVLRFIEKEEGRS